MKVHQLDWRYRSPDLDQDQLRTDYDTFENYEGVEGNDDAVAAIKGYRQKGYLMEFDTLAEVTDYLRSAPVLSKLGCIVKEKVNKETGTVTKKSRIILDCKRSLVSKYASRTFKSVLPRISDAVKSAMKLIGSCKDGESATLFIADVSDAFWLIPLHFSERKYFVAKLSDRYYVFLRTAQGSRGAPLSFAVIMALACRCVQSVLCRVQGREGAPEGMVQTYVDDPLTILRGDNARQRRLACMISIVWMLLGIPMAFHKAILADELVWIGVSLRLDAKQVTVEVTEAKILELVDMIEEMLTANLVPTKKLSSLVGKCMAIASVIYVWRPFLQSLYAAIHEPGQAPKGCVWTRQIKHTLLWLHAFLKGESGTLQRIYLVDKYHGIGDRVQITWDASPFGMGAFLTINGTIVEYFAIPISADDEVNLEAKSGGCEGQQLWECLSGLIAMRQWSSSWRQARVHLHLRGDNVASLVLFSALKTHSKQLAIIAREFALDLGVASFRPEVIQHLPGIANVLADSLSRKFDPHKTFVLHPALQRATEVTPPPRPKSWWRSLAEPSMPASPLADTRAWSRKRPRI